MGLCQLQAVAPASIQTPTKSPQRRGSTMCIVSTINTRCSSPGKFTPAVECKSLSDAPLASQVSGISRTAQAACRHSKQCGLSQAHGSGVMVLLLRAASPVMLPGTVSDILSHVLALAAHSYVLAGGGRTQNSTCSSRMFCLRSHPRSSSSGYWWNITTCKPPMLAHLGLSCHPCACRVSWETHFLGKSASS